VFSSKGKISLGGRRKLEGSREKREGVDRRGLFLDYVRNWKGGTLVVEECPEKKRTGANMQTKKEAARIAWQREKKNSSA